MSTSQRQHWGETAPDVKTLLIHTAVKTGLHAELQRADGCFLSLLYYTDYVTFENLICFCLSGPLKPEVTVAYIAVSLIFFNSGLSLKTEVSCSHPASVLSYGTCSVAFRCSLEKSPSLCAGADQCAASRAAPPLCSVLHPHLLPTRRLAAAQGALTDRHRPMAAQRVGLCVSVCLCVWECCSLFSQYLEGWHKDTFTDYYRPSSMCLCIMWDFPLPREPPGTGYFIFFHSFVLRSVQVKSSD